MPRNPYFKQRTIAEINQLHIDKAYKQRGLAEKIAGLDPSEEGLIINCQLIPGNFYQNVKTSHQAAGKLYNHGHFLKLEHPKSQKECDKSPTIPLKLRQEAFSILEQMKEEEIDSIGFSFHPSWGDRLRREVPFVWCPEALKLFAYSENSSEPIKARVYGKAERVKNEGAGVIFEVPSRRRNIPEYMFKLLHVPVTRSEHNLATVLTLKPGLLQDEDGRIISQRIPHDSARIRYPYERELQSSETITFYPHDIAGYIAIVRDSVKAHNLTPLEMNPFPLFSREGIDFYKKLCNNILIFDPNFNRKDKLRKPYIAEKSILLARTIGKFGHDRIAFWDPTKDGKLADYDWSI